MHIYRKNQSDTVYKSNKKKINLISCLVIFLLINPILLFAQESKITFSVKNVTLEQLFDTIEQKSNYKFSYRDIVVNQKENVTLNVSGLTIEQILNKVLPNRQLQYAITGNNIVITTKGTTGKTGKTISGTITDITGEPIIGANVVEKGTTNGTVTDLNGQYTLNISGKNVEISYIGYLSQTIETGNNSIVNVKLTEDMQTIDEVVVVGYGTQKKVNLIGAISSVGSDVFESKPVNNVGQALQGLVPNLNIDINNGSPNTVPNFNIRGGTTISTDGKITNGNPLILIDGVEASATDINLMNPGDIESLVTIKDASAAAIYGTRATNGVILATTKSGQFDQKVKVSYSYDIRWNTPSAIPDVLDAHTQYLSGIYATNLRTWAKRGNYKELSTNEQRIADGILKYQQNPTPENNWMYESPGDPNSKVIWVGDMNPFNTFLRDWTPTQQHSLNLSGGSKTVRYYFSGGYNDQEGFYKIGTDQYNRYSFSANVEANLTNKISLSTKISYNRSTYDSPYMVAGKGSVWEALRNNVERNLRMPLRTGENDPVPNAWSDNIISWMAYGAKERTMRETTYYNLNANYKILPELTLKGEVSYKPNNESRKETVPENPHIEPGDWALKTTQTTNGNENRLSQTKSNLYTVNIYANFDKTFNKKHIISGVIGYNQESLGSESHGIFATHLISSSVPAVDLSSEAKQRVNYSGYDYTSRGVFGRINYNFMERYLLEVNGRYDGSSRFTPSERFKFFPSFSAGWRASEEPFMVATKSWLDNLKFRVSYGSLGSQPSSYYPFSSLLSGGSSAGFILDGKNVVYVGAPSDLVSSKLKWETISTLNFGTDITLIQNRLNLTLDVFSRRTTDILLAGTEYPATLVAKAPLVNSGELHTYGWELTAGWRDKLKNGFSYDLNFSLSDAQSEVVSYPANDNNKLLSSIYSGKKNGEIWGYETDRLFQQEDFVQNPDGTWKLAYEHDQSVLGGSNLFPGDVKYKDQNGDKKITKGAETLEDHGDMVLLGNETPRFRYALTANLAYKGFDLYLFFQGTGKRDYWIGSASYRPGSDNAGSWEMLNQSWTPENVNAKFPTYNANGQNWVKQSGYMIDASYFRLKQMSFGYSLPKSLLSKVGIDKLRIFLSAYNVFEFTKIPKVFDPDMISDAYPNFRSVSVGGQLVF